MINWRKELYSKINEVAEDLLEDSSKCHGCPFRHDEYPREYGITRDTCSHSFFEYEFEEYDAIPEINPNKRPDNCPIKWRFNK